MTTDKTPPRSQQTANSAQIAQLLEYAEFLVVQGRVLDARLHYHLAVEQDRSAVAALKFAEFLINVGDVGAAEETLRELDSRAIATDDLPLQSAVALQFAALARLQRDSTAARQWTNRALASELAGTSTEAKLSAASLSQVANDALQAGDFSRAEQLFRAALAAEVDRGDIEGQADDLGSLGLVHALQGQMSEALKLLWQAHELHERIDDYTGAASDLMNIALVAGSLGSWDASVKLLQHARETAERVQATPLLQRIDVQLADARQILDVSRRNPQAN